MSLYDCGISAGRTLVEDECSCGINLRKFYCYRDFRQKFSDSEWQNWKGSPLGPHGAADDVAFASCNSEDRNDPLFLSGVPYWWALNLNPDADPEVDPCLTSDQYGAICIPEFVRGFVDGIVLALRETPGVG